MNKLDMQGAEASKPAGKLTLLEHLEKIIKLSEKTGLSEAFLEKARSHIEFAAQKLNLTSIQAVLFAHFLNRCDDQSIRINEIAESIQCGKIQLIQYMNEFDELEKRKLLCCCREHKFVSYRVPLDVINALRKDEEYKPVNHQNISITEFFTVLEELFEQRSDNELTSDALFAELNALIDENRGLLFSRKIRSYQLDAEDTLLLVGFCHFFVNNDDDNIGAHDIENIYDDRYGFKHLMKSLKDGDHILMEMGFIENTNSDCFGDRDFFKLTDRAKEELFEDLNIKEKQGKSKKGLVLFDALPAKKMFYNKKEAGKIQELAALLKEEYFKTIQQRLADNGMRTGFACLFYGPPGTGKTETVYQIARETRRDIMLVDIAETKSMWFGESEKRIKEVFDRYKSCVEHSDIAPILLFNEADAVIGKRIEITHSTVAQTENAMQNIILQEIENLTGILIATTNLTRNMDKAFERRFLYKIAFEKPGLESRKSIWQSIIPVLPDEQAQELAARYDFSGGQIENVARKRTVECIISGAEPSLDTLLSWCHDESLAKEDSIRIGFGREEKCNI
jgi:hypothetical protein